MQSIEKVMEKSKELGYTINLLFSNTDGFMVDIDERYLDELKVIIDDITKITGIELEYELCKEMYQANVNNFVLIKDDDSVKLKGQYEIDKELHKNPSMRIVSIAAANYFINGITPEVTINNHLKRNKANKYVNSTYEIYYSKKHNNKVINQGIYDFMILNKTDDRFAFYEVNKNNDKVLLQKSIRYIITTVGNKLIKVNKATDAYSLLQATKKIYEQVFNKIPNVKLDSQEMTSFEQCIPINFNYYIKEAYKLIYSVEGYQEKQQLLF